MNRALACVIGVIVLWSCALGLTPAASDSPASPPIRFRLLDTTGTVHSDQEWASARAIVLFFVTPDCPVSQSYVPEMNRLESAYTGHGVRFYAVQSDASYNDTVVRQHTVEYGYRFPMLLDRDQRLLRQTGATTTPEAFVLTPRGQALYRGRIDNRIVSLGVKRPQATEFDLRDAIGDVLAGHPVARPRTTAYGCIIPTHR